MGECTGCYNGCTEIYSDKCVRYTGNDITFLGIETDMPLAEVEEKITDYLAQVLTGAGIVPTLPDTICTLVNGYLPSSGDITLVDVISALISSACSLQTDVTSLSNSISTIEADYSISCLTGVTASSGTHDILQAVINQVCTSAANITSLQNALATYVRINDIDTYIQNYLTANETSSTKEYTKMVPYTVVEYYGDLTGKFDITGAGIGDWEQIYLCNGENGTPDKRGRFAVGANTMGDDSYVDYETDPAYGNPVYALMDKAGLNKVSLITANIPAHKHNVTVNISDPSHFHYMFNNNIISYDSHLTSTNHPAQESTYGTNRNYDIIGTTNTPTLGRSGMSSTGITVDSVDVSNTGQNISHENRPPAIACYYIMHIPS